MLSTKKRHIAAWAAWPIPKGKNIDGKFGRCKIVL